MRSKRSTKAKIIRRKIAGRFNLKIFFRKYTNTMFLVVKILLLIALLSLSIYFFLFSDNFNVKSIEILGTKRFVNIEDLSEIAESQLLYKNIFKIKASEVEKTLENNFMGAKKMTVSRSFPSKVIVQVQERIPIAIFFNEEDGDHFLIDDEGYVLGFADKDGSDLPRIRYQNEIEVGLFIDKDLVPLYMELTSILEQEQVPVSSLSFSLGYVSFFVQNGPEVFIGNAKNKIESIKAVSALIKQTQLENKDIARIDLRYDKVIVLFE